LRHCNKEGEPWPEKINQYTRILTLPLAIIQSIGSICLIRQAASMIGGVGDITAHSTFVVLMVAALTGGRCCLCVWRTGHRTKALAMVFPIITAGIISRLPANISEIVGRSG